MSEMQQIEVLQALLTAMREVRLDIADARTQLVALPESVQNHEAMAAPQRIAAKALLKSVEQLEDLIARTLRAALVYEQLDLSGLSPRAIADQAEKIGIISSSDCWSDLVRLRNRLVHEYPMGRQEKLGRLTLAWHAADELVAISEGLIDYFALLNIEEQP